MVPSATQVTGSTQNQELDEFLVLFAALNTVSKTADESNAAESNKTFGVFLEMLKEMKASMQANSEEMHQLRERLNTSESQNKELNALREAEKQAAGKRVAALEARIEAQARELIKVKADQDALKQRPATHTQTVVYYSNVNGNDGSHK